MKQQNTTPKSITFQKWFYNTPAFKFKELRQQIIDACKLEKDDRNRCPVFYHWCRGITPVPDLAQEKINAIAGINLNYNTADFDIKPNTIKA